MKVNFLLIGLLATQMLAVDKAYSQTKPLNLSGPYLGQKLPDLKPEVFAPNIVSTPGWEVSGVFSPDLKEFYFIRGEQIKDKFQQEFVVIENIDNQWHERIISGRIGQPFISLDGNTMHLGKRYKQRTSEGWSDIKDLSEDFGKYRIMRLTSSKKGTYVFDEAIRDGKGKLRYSRLVNGKREAPKPLGKNINAGQWNAHPFIAADESYIIWDGQRVSDVRNADLFISFRQSDGTYGEAIPMGPEINTPSSEAGARVSPDGKFLFFNRKVGEFETKDGKGGIKTLSNIDIFWVDASIIDKLKPKS